MVKPQLTEVAIWFGVPVFVGIVIAIIYDVATIDARIEAVRAPSPQQHARFEWAERDDRSGVGYGKPCVSSDVCYLVVTNGQSVAVTPFTGSEKGAR